MSLIVRRAVLEDARTIADYAQKLVAQHQEYNPKRFSQIATEEQMANFYGNQVKAQDATVLVAELEGKIVGFAFVKFEIKNYADLLEYAAWLHDIYIDETARNHNAGKLLTEAAVEAAKEFGAEKLMLMTASQNEYAREFFERNGFRKTMVEMMLDLTEEKGND
jgi:GNAT superfamily N-acetyltransferase